MAITTTKTKFGAVADFAFDTEDAAINIAVLANDLQPGTPKTLTALSSGTSNLGAKITINANGTVNYDPAGATAIQALAQGEQATDTFNYTMKELGTSYSAKVTVNLTGVNDAPVISGTKAGQTTTDTTTITPFSAVTIKDVDNGAQDSLTIKVLDSQGNASDANGTLTGSGLSKAGVGTYTFSATSPGSLTGELDQVVFTPTAHQGAAGSTVTTKFALSASDGFATTNDATTSVVTTETARDILGYQFTLVDVPGAHDTTGRDINNSGVIGGSYFVPIPGTNKFIETGFLSTNGLFTPVVFPGAFDTTVNGINDHGDVTGTYDNGVPAPTFPTSSGYVLHDGVYTTIGVNLIPDEINNAGVVAGFHANADTSFTFDVKTGAFTEFSHGTDSTFARDINDQGIVVGSYSTGLQEHGFLYQDGTMTTVDIPNATRTVITAINNDGDIAGDYDLTNGNVTTLLGFLMQKDQIGTGQFTSFAISNVRDLNINDVVIGSDNSGNGSLVYGGDLTNGKVINVQPQGTEFADLSRINDSNVITGGMQFAGTSTNHGFFATPILDPTS